MKVSRDSSSDEEDNTGDDDRIGSFLVFFTFEEFFLGKTVGAIEESEDDKVGEVKASIPRWGGKEFLDVFTYGAF